MSRRSDAVRPEVPAKDAARVNRRTLVKQAGAAAGLGVLAASGVAKVAAAPASRRRTAYRQDATELTMWVSFPELDLLLTELIPRYAEVNPNVTVTKTLYPQRALEEKMAAALPAGQGPDVFAVDRFEIFPYYLNEEASPFTGEMADYITQNWPEFAVTGATAPESGELYALPWITSPKMMFYNQTMFEAAGITALPTTVDEMMAAAEKLTVRDANGRITTQGIDLRLTGGGAGLSQKFWTQAMIPHGAPVLAADGDRYSAGYGNEQGAAALNMYLNALYTRKVATYDVKHDAEGFGLGQAAMFQRESWVVTYLQQTHPDLRYGAFPMPKGPGGWGTVPNTIAIGMTSTSQNQEAAMEFLRWLTDEANTVATYDISGWQPWRTEGIDFGDLFTRKPVLKQFIDVLNMPDHQLFDYQNIPPISEIHTRLADRLVGAFEMQEITDDLGAVQEVVNETADETNRILSDWDLLAE